MLTTLRARAQREEGFTLIELLVVILIIGILAAIAIPSFLNQKTKGEDASAKSAVRAAQTAMETFYTDNNTYVATADNLRTVEETIPATGTGAGQFQVNSSSTTGYDIQVKSKDGNRTFKITKSGSTVSRSCTVDNGTNRGGCPGTSGTGAW